MLSIVICAALLLGAPAVASAPDQTKINFSPRYQVGAPVFYKHSLIMQQRQRYRDYAEGVVSLHMESELRFNVTRLLPGGGAEVELTFNRLKIDAVPSSAPRFQYDTEFDHDRPGTERYVNTIRRVLSTAVMFELSSTGQVRQVMGAREIERLVEGEPGFELIAGVLSERWFREVAQDVFGAAGVNATRTVGETWRSQLALTLGGFPGPGTNVEWTLADADDHIATIEGDGEPTPPVQTHEGLQDVGQSVTGAHSKFLIQWDLDAQRARLVEKSEAMSLEYRSDDFLLGVASLGTHSLLEASNP